MTGAVSADGNPAGLVFPCICAVLGLLILVRRIAARSSPCTAAPVLFPHGPVEMKMDGSDHTFIAPDKTLMRMLWKEIYAERCYDSSPLTPLDVLATEAKQQGRDVVVFDVGGNIGVFARYAAEAIIAAGGSAQVHSFEPIPPVYGLHKKNTVGLGKAVRVHHFGLCAGTAETPPATVTFEYFPGLPGNGTMKFEERDSFQKKLFASTEGVNKYLSSLSAKNRTLRCIMALVYPCRAALVQRWFAGRAANHIPYECELRTAASVIEAEGVSVIDLLKVDVEGAELDVLKGISPGQWKLVRQVVAEVHDVNGRLAEVQRLLGAQGVGGFTQVKVEQEEMFATLGQPTFMVYAVR